MTSKRKPIFSVTKKDLRVEATRGSGKGGQHRNKKDTAIRITHIESKAVGFSCDERSQHRNKMRAFMRMLATSKFKVWQKRKMGEAVLTSEERRRREDAVHAAVRRTMHPDNLIVEVGDGHNWKREEATDEK